MQGTGGAACNFLRRWSLPGLQHTPDSQGDLFGTLSQNLVKSHYAPSSCFSIKKSTFGYRHIEHLFKTECLGAKLYVISILTLAWTAFLVLNGIGPPCVSIPVELHNISSAVKPQPG